MEEKNESITVSTATGIFMSVVVPDGDVPTKLAWESVVQATVLLFCDVLWGKASRFCGYENRGKA